MSTLRPTTDPEQERAAEMLAVAVAMITGAIVLLILHGLI